jgi:hypothetical protein
MKHSHLFPLPAWNTVKSDVDTLLRSCLDLVPGSLLPWSRVVTSLLLVNSPKEKLGQYGGPTIN